MTGVSNGAGRQSGAGNGLKPGALVVLPIKPKRFSAQIVGVQLIALGDTPTVVLMGGVLLSGLYWITQRRAEVAKTEAQDKGDTR